MTWQQDVAAFSRRMAVQHIGYWRAAKRDGLPVTATFSRRMALHYLAKARQLES